MKLVIVTPCCLWVMLLAAGCSSPNGRSQYSGVGRYLGASAGAQQAVSANVTLQDCGYTVVLRVDDCSLRGNWVPQDIQTGGSDPTVRWRYGTIAVNAGQSCTFSLQRGSVVLTVSNGVVKVAASRAIDVALSGTASGADVGPATFNFTAAPAAPPVPVDCASGA